MPRPTLIVWLVAFVVATLVAARAATVTSIEVSGTEFVARTSDGRTLRSADLVGATIDVTTSDGTLKLRIDAVEPDPGSPAIAAKASNAVLLHTFSYRTAEGEWRNLCDAGPDGRRQGFPIAGRAKAGGGGTIEPAEPGVFELTCTAGAQGKCVRLGYHPWDQRPDGSPMLPFYNACIRLVRADYSGDGHSTTRDGRLIDIYDLIGVQSQSNLPGQQFEAGWSPEGAICVRHVRIKENVSLQELERTVPRLKGRLGDICTEDFARSEGAILFNRSAP